MNIERKKPKRNLCPTAFVGIIIASFLASLEYFGYRESETKKISKTLRQACIDLNPKFGENYMIHHGFYKGNYFTVTSIDLRNTSVGGKIYKLAGVHLVEIDTRLYCTALKNKPINISNFFYKKIL